MSRPLLKSTTTTGLATLLSRITGLLRDSFMAQAIGVGPISDAFYVAFKIPNFLRRLFAEGAFSQSFVPVISEYKTQRGQAEVRELVAGVSGTLGGVLLLLSIVGVIAAPVIIFLFAPRWGVAGSDQFDLAVQMLRWTFPYLFFISLVSLFSGVLNSYGRFFIPAITQVVMNLVMIVAALLFAAHSDNPGLVLAIGVFVSGALQLVFQLPSVARLGLLSIPRWRPTLEGVRRVGKLMIPGIVGSSMAQISLLLDTQIATALVTGSVSWLYFADGLFLGPDGLQLRQGAGAGVLRPTGHAPSGTHRHDVAGGDDEPEPVRGAAGVAAGLSESACPDRDLHLHRRGAEYAAAVARVAARGRAAAFTWMDAVRAARDRGQPRDGRAVVVAGGRHAPLGHHALHRARAARRRGHRAG